MLEQPCSLRLDELGNHVAENGANGVEPLIGGADVVEAVVVEQNLLHNKDGDSLAKF